MTVGFCCFRLPLDDFDNFRAADGEDDAEVVFFSIDLVLGGFLDVVVKEEEEEGDVRFSMASPCLAFLSFFSVFSAFFIFFPFFSFVFAFVSLCGEGSGVCFPYVSPPSLKVDLVVVDLILCTW